LTCLYSTQARNNVSIIHLTASTGAVVVSSQDMNVLRKPLKLHRFTVSQVPRIPGPNEIRAIT